MLSSSITPLVSVVVITYNSSGTVIETLDSVKNQTYQNIELIVTDDCSTDNTLEIVRTWLNDNPSRFVRSEVVAAERNTGVSGNNNRGVAKAYGEWIKMVAGDDLLLPNCIEEFVSFIGNNKEQVRICVSDVEPFCVDGEVPKSLIDTYARFLEMEKESYEQQRRRIMTGLAFVGPGLFISRELFVEVGGFSEEYGNAEEWPFFYKIIMGGNRIYVLDKKLVRYRYVASSLCHFRDDKGLTKRSYFEGRYRHYFDHAFKDLIHDGRPFTAWHHALSFWTERIQYNISNRALRKIAGYAIMSLSPLTYLRKLKIVNR